MPLPRWLARLNRRVLNPREIAGGTRPVLHHVGRRSGQTHRTPLQAMPVEGGFVIDLLYGVESDWVRNVLAADGALLDVEGRRHELVRPRLVDATEADDALGRTSRRARRDRQALRLDTHAVRTTKGSAGSDAPEPRRRRRWLRTIVLTLVTTVLGFAVGGATTTAAGPAISDVDAGAVPFAGPGPHAVGVTALPAVDGLPALTYWYPAQAGVDDEPVDYDVRLLVGGPLGGIAVGTVYGRAVVDASVALGPPPPLAVLAPGYGIRASSYGWLAEHLASHGIAVVAHEPEETLASAMGDGLWQSAVDRPAVLSAIIGHLRSRARAGDAAWDAGRVAVIGHSIGGHAALAVGGARLDTEAFAARCDDGDPEAAWLCGVLADELDALGARAGVTGEPRPRLVPDAEVAAVVSLAGDAYLFDRDGLATMTAPVLAIGGLDDTGTPWGLGAGMTVASAGSERRIAVGLAGAEHLVFLGRCDRVRRVTPWIPMDLCEDADGDRATRHDVIAHVTTAFLRDTLMQDPEARAILDAVGDLPDTTFTTIGGDDA